LSAFVRQRLGEPDTRAFCLRLYEGVLKHLADIDQRLSASADNWKLHRMATVDRNALRLGAFEFIALPGNAAGGRL